MNALTLLLVCQSAIPLLLLSSSPSATAAFAFKLPDFWGAGGTTILEIPKMFGLKGRAVTTDKPTKAQQVRVHIVA